MTPSLRNFVGKAGSLEGSQAEQVGVFSDLSQRRQPRAERAAMMEDFAEKDDLAVVLSTRQRPQQPIPILHIGNRHVFGIGTNQGTNPASRVLPPSTRGFL